MSKRKGAFDEVGYWSEVKLEIVRKYATAYSTILSKQRGFTHWYVDGFAGAGEHKSKTTGEMVPGSPLNALAVRPPFHHFYLIDLDGERVAGLRAMIGDRADVTLLEGDCNRVLRDDVLPRVEFRKHRRALLLLDPYGLQLDWDVLALAGKLATIDLFLNFPIMDMNRNALWRDPTGVAADDAARMTRFWGDESWRTVAYQPARQKSLFGAGNVEKQSNEAIVAAFRDRLKKVAGFKNVPAPMPMRNTTNAVVYYLFFASQNATANRVVSDIFKKYRDHRGA
ncbi:MAG TPA: three-Cys-motif partner protein TcmP [Thermoleophilia bacterium]|nr:three-Cys-motif partner protein TcmP [Thermoleophilia bacterium]